MKLDWKLHSLQSHFAKDFLSKSWWKEWLVTLQSCQTWTVPIFDFESYFASRGLSHTNMYYNVPRACLLNRSPAPAIDLKSSRSGLWPHTLETCRRLRRFVANIQTMSRDMIKLQLSQHFCHATKIFCRGTWVSCRVEVTLCCDFYTFRSCNTCTFSLTTFAVLRHAT